MMINVCSPLISQNHHRHLPQAHSPPADLRQQLRRIRQAPAERLAGDGIFGVTKDVLRGSQNLELDGVLSDDECYDDSSFFSRFEMNLSVFKYSRSIFGGDFLMFNGNVPLILSLQQGHWNGISNQWIMGNLWGPQARWDLGPFHRGTMKSTARKWRGTELSEEDGGSHPVEQLEPGDLLAMGFLVGYLFWAWSPQ